MLEEYKSRTDLALEANEQIKDEGKQSGIDRKSTRLNSSHAT